MERDLINYLRVTSCLEIERAKSGHPGVSLSMAPTAFMVYKHAFLNPSEPNFINRDRIVFSAGHASALVYACLNLFGYDVSTEDLKNFRQLNSKTPGHPEVGLTPGVDASTGPLGQGVGMAVGMAIAESYLRARYERGSLSPISHYTFCLVGDGDLMEGVAWEAISLAGHLRLNKLILLYDKNDVTIEGQSSIANSENVLNKFISQNWNVINVANGNDEGEIERAILSAKTSDKPTVIIVNTKIGFGSEMEGDASVHGKPLSSPQIAKLRENLNYFAPDFTFPERAKDYLEKLKQSKQKQWQEYLLMLDEYKRKFSDEFAELNNIDDNFMVDFSSFLGETKDKFDGRNEGHLLINKLANIMPNLLCASADLTPSTRTNFANFGFFRDTERTNRNLALGVREHAMGAVCNGISLHGGLRTICSTFLVFENYMAPAVRMSAYMSTPVLYYFTHDSISVGEDGPTHQPVEQLATLRAIPNIFIFRPCGVKELHAGFEVFFKNTRPQAMIIPRQVTSNCGDDYAGATRGGYEIYKKKGNDITIVATGSEVEIAIKCAEILAQKNIRAKVVSMPCVKLFETQDKVYKNKVIDRTKPVFCVECSSDSVWYKFATNPDFVINLTTFGKSGKMEDLLNYFGFTPQKLADKILKLLNI